MQPVQTVSSVNWIPAYFGFFIGFCAIDSWKGEVVTPVVSLAKGDANGDLPAKGDAKGKVSFKLSCNLR